MPFSDTITFYQVINLSLLSAGATKEIGTALTRICLRHKSVETRMKTFTSTIMDSLIIPLQVSLDNVARNSINPPTRCC